MLKISFVVWLIMGCFAFSPLSAGAANTLSFNYGNGQSVANSNVGLRGHEAKLPKLTGKVYIYATFDMGSSNPLKCIDGRPNWQQDNDQSAKVENGKATASDTFFIQPEPAVKRDANQPQNLQIVTLGEKTGQIFTPVIQFGLADDGRAPVGMAHVTPWVNNGMIDYFGLYARPQTPYDFRIRLDLDKRSMTAWVSGRGDDNWYLLAENVTLLNNISTVNQVQVLQYPGAPAIRDVRFAAEPIPSAEKIHNHPLAKKDRAVAPDKGFRFQAMRSTWCKPGKHVTIFRKPGVHAGFPDVAQAGQEHLVCVWRNGSHTGNKGGLSLAHSYDLGKTWTDPVV
ncbi:MAG: hypothetical protein WCT39_06635, partial [Candidatus Margulisiibacteriota bacterium]